MSDSDAPLSIRLLTALAPGGVAVLRVAGAGVVELLHRACRRMRTDAPASFALGRFTHCRLCDGADVLDEVIVSIDESGGAEICLHGGVRVVQRAILLLERLGARRIDSTDANPPDFGLDVGAAVDAVLPRATTRAMARWLLRQRMILPAFVDRLRGRETPGVDVEEHETFLARSRAAIRAVSGPRIALVGPPNAGKSTLANALIGRERIITSDQPGTTRDWVEETAILAGWPITLTDTAGTRPTGDALEAEAIRRGQERARAADLVVTVIDATTIHSASVGWVIDPPAVPMAERPPADVPPVGRVSRPDAVGLFGTGIVGSGCVGMGNVGSADPTYEVLSHIVLNKADLLTDSQRAAVPNNILLVSAMTGEGMADLERALAARLGLDRLRDDQPAAFLESQLAAFAAAGV